MSPPGKLVAQCVPLGRQCPWGNRSVARARSQRRPLGAPRDPPRCTPASGAASLHHNAVASLAEALEPGLPFHAHMLPRQPTVIDLKPEDRVEVTMTRFSPGARLEPLGIPRPTRDGAPKSKPALVSPPALPRVRALAPSRAIPRPQSRASRHSPPADAPLPPPTIPSPDHSRSRCAGSGGTRASRIPPASPASPAARAHSAGEVGPQGAALSPPRLPGPRPPHSRPAHRPPGGPPRRAPGPAVGALWAPPTGTTWRWR